jgi:signal peptidase I
VTPTDSEQVDVDASASDSPFAPARSRARRVALEWAVIIIVALVGSIFIRTFVVQSFFIPSKSMEPTLWPGDRILVDKLSVELGHVNVGDVVVFRAPPGVKTQCLDAVSVLVKRVIGLPGDVLTSRGNTIVRNGHPLAERWSHWEPLGGPITRVRVPANTYFVMGDNHANSCDSRMWGTVPASSVIGKVVVVVWPWSHLRWL